MPITYNFAEYLLCACHNAFKSAAAKIIRKYVSCRSKNFKVTFFIISRSDIQDITTYQIIIMVLHVSFCYGMI